MKKHYLFFVSVAYSYPILRPLQDEIKRRGDDVAWFIEPDCPVLLDQDERWLQSVQEVMDYQLLPCLRRATIFMISSRE